MIHKGGKPLAGCVAVRPCYVHTQHDAVPGANAMLRSRKGRQQSATVQRGGSEAVQGAESMRRPCIKVVLIFAYSPLLTRPSSRLSLGQSIATAMCWFI